MISLENKQTGTNYLLDSDNQHIVSDFGKSFDLRHGYGFDECFPTIEPCNYKSKNGIIELPDHG